MRFYYFTMALFDLLDIVYYLFQPFFKETLQIWFPQFYASRVLTSNYPLVSKVNLYVVNILYCYCNIIIINRENIVFSCLMLFGQFPKFSLIMLYFYSHLNEPLLFFSPFKQDNSLVF